MDVSVFFPTLPSLCVCCSHAVCACCARHHPAFLAVHTGSGGAGVFMSPALRSPSLLTPMSLDRFCFCYLLGLRKSIAFLDQLERQGCTGSHTPWRLCGFI